MASLPRDEASASLLRAARLARIGLNAEEAQVLAPQFGAILAALGEAAVVEEPQAPAPPCADSGAPLGVGRTRPDQESEPLGRARLLPLAPETSGDFYRVPRSEGGPR